MSLYPVKSDITCASLAKRMGREPTVDERINDVMNNQAITDVIAGKMGPPLITPYNQELVDKCLRLSAKEEGLSVADYCRLNDRPIPYWARHKPEDWDDSPLLD